MTFRRGTLKEIRVGFGGHRGQMLGFHYKLAGEGWEVIDSWGFWAQDRTGTELWTEADREQVLGRTLLQARQLLHDAQVSDLMDLIGSPIVATFGDGGSLQTWRIAA